MRFSIGNDRVPPRLACGLAIAVAVACGCGDRANVPFERTLGPRPVLPEPSTSLIPTVEIAPAVGWPPGLGPISPQGLVVQPFASGLDHPRWLAVLPDGAVLVAESSAPQPEEEPKGFKATIMELLKKRAGSAVPSADRITLLRDTDGDGLADQRHVLVANLHSPFGMALIGEDLYIANTDAIVRVRYDADASLAIGDPQKITDLPGGKRHWPRNLLASPDGTRLYATVGSASDHAENGIEQEEGRAAIWEVDLPSGTKRLFASGLRNPNGLAWEPATGEMWTVVNERDELGSDLVPDYLTRVRRGAFYGWPYSYWGEHVDERVEPRRPDLVAAAVRPDYALGNHVAALGLVFAREAPSLSGTGAGGVFIGQHGSWNREPPSGYNVVFVPFEDGEPAGLPIEVLGGFVNADGEALGRPVGVALTSDGSLLVADDVGNTVWLVRDPTRAARAPAAGRP